MTCCDGRGIIRFKFRNGDPDEYGVCLCPVGLRMRDHTNGGHRNVPALWEVWAHRNQVNPDQVGMLEEFLDDDELRERFPTWQRDAGDGAAAVSDIAAAMRTQRVKL